MRAQEHGGNEGSVPLLPCRCPYCDAPVRDDSFVCQPCQVRLISCPGCRRPVADTARRCPHCEQELTPARSGPTETLDKRSRLK